ncbi:MAG TPA: alpha/beta family hydrolase [Myxococcota bacterium]|nr:alpha/beta family hydrolase [Myxococcota bacterium]
MLVDGPPDARTTLVLGHGAGGPMDAPYLQAVAADLSARGIRVVRFEFPYMAKRRETGTRGALDRPPVLLATWRELIEKLGGGSRLAIGGKSLGGRIASMLADEVGARALVCLGYPFHPIRHPDRLRTAHLEAIRTPMLIVQGTRDPFGVPEEVAGYRISPAIRIRWIDGGDHDLRPPARSGRSQAENLRDACDAVAGFLAELDGPGAEGS